MASQHIVDTERVEQADRSGYADSHGLVGLLTEAKQASLDAARKVEQAEKAIQEWCNQNDTDVQQGAEVGSNHAGQRAVALVQSDGALKAEIIALKADRDQAQADLKLEQAAHTKTKEDWKTERRHFEGQVEALQRNTDVQRQAVEAFLEYCSRSLTHGHSSVLASSRFNRTVTPSAALDLPWILDTLDRVVRVATSESADSSSIASPGVQDLVALYANCRLSDATDDAGRLPAMVVVERQPDPYRVLFMLLQGIAYAHLALRVSGDATWATTPRDLLEALSATISSRGAVLGQIYQRVQSLVLQDIAFTSWIDAELDIVDGLFNSSNSALPEGVVLLQDTPGTVVMARAGGQLFVFDERVLQVVLPIPPNVVMRLPAVDGLDLRQLQLSNEHSQSVVMRWASSIRRRVRDADGRSNIV